MRGFLLGRSLKEITPFGVIVAIDGPSVLDGCLLGFQGCGDDSPCPVHSYWKKSKDTIIDVLHNKNIEELGRELHPKLELIKQSKSEK